MSIESIRGRESFLQHARKVRSAHTHCFVLPPVEDREREESRKSTSSSNNEQNALNYHYIANFLMHTARGAPQESLVLYKATV